MTLDAARESLKARLRSAFAFAQGEEIETLRYVDQWWVEYKVWEANDRFVTAIDEGRMSVRQGTPSQTYGEYMGKEAEFAFGARQGEVEKVLYPKERYRTGVDSIKERMDPSFFGLEDGERKKYKHGLHDLSASLMTPTLRLITKQVRWKYAELGKRITIFMPLAKPQDMAMFHELNFKAKQAQTLRPFIHKRVIEIRNRMTRIKLAEDTDIGAGLHNIAAPGEPVKLRYGVKKLGRRLWPTDRGRQGTAGPRQHGLHVHSAGPAAAGRAACCPDSADSRHPGRAAASAASPERTEQFHERNRGRLSPARRRTFSTFRKVGQHAGRFPVSSWREKLAVPRDRQDPERLEDDPGAMSRVPSPDVAAKRS
jgi:hypothetical protein